MFKTFKRQWLTIIFPILVLMAITNPSAEDYYSYAYQGVKKIFILKIYAKEVKIVYILNFDFQKTIIKGYVLLSQIIFYGSIPKKFYL
ncbi:hypothetical protein [Nostoc sp.]|uniref:hypothetical protein n=1 Tax=Nostoc sp. TaxID=1180 RepID=UPI002FF53255